MKIYFFYKLTSGLEPILYAFTTDKEKADLFSKIRSGYYQKVKKCTQNEYIELYDTHKDYGIELHDFKTSNGFRKYSVILPATGYEIKEIILHKDDLVMAELQKYALPINLFAKDIQEAFNVIGYKQISNFIENTGRSFDFIENEPLENFEVDELGLFLCLHRDILQTKRIRDIYEK